MTDNIRHNNYEDQLKWFNTKVRPHTVIYCENEYRPFPSFQDSTDSNTTPINNNDNDRNTSDNSNYNNNNVQDDFNHIAVDPTKRKRTGDLHANDPIDLTDSQPKRKRYEKPASPKIDLTEDNNNYDDNFFDDDFDDFSPTENAINRDEDLGDFFDMDEDDIMDLDNIASTETQRKNTEDEDVQEKLNTLKERQNDINNQIVEILNGNGDQEQQKALLDERNQIVDELKRLEKLVTTKQTIDVDRFVPESIFDDDFEFDDNDIDDPMMDYANEDDMFGNVTATGAVGSMATDQTLVEEAIVLDDDEEDVPIQVSPFFGNTNTPVSIPTEKATAPPAVAVSSQPTFPWSRDVRKALIQNFKLSEFRPNQLEAINTTLGGEDVFVLMPTGGGKSLCYQLPAIIQRFDRQGVTFVVSPLLSLMQDQVEQLVVGKGIAAGMLNSTVSVSQKRWIYEDLRQPVPRTQLLYITPELLSASDQLRSVLDDLYKRNKLARFVIDEAHCVSQWGHDFRPDYKQLGFLKETYKTVPLMALTATANESVQKDVLFNLKISNCKVLKQSFNRNNLKYEVVRKSKTVFQDMKQFIMRRSGQSGIIYCCTKKNCEQVTEDLQKIGVSIKHYHAGLTTSERSEVQREWQTGQIQVIAATIAFGMGIDKPDVRFVLHYSVPSSVEGYYQETGRAGRDGKMSVCRLYFSYADARTHNFLIDKGEGRWEQKQRQRDNLNTMLRFCDNQTDCRRKQILSYFGENFSAAQCNRMCDNCIQNQNVESTIRDMSDNACILLKLIKEIVPSHITVAQVIDIYRGSRAKRVLEHGYNRLEGWGHGRTKHRTEVDRILRAMIHDNVIREKSECNAGGFPITYVIPSTKANDLLAGRLKVLITYSQNSLRDATPRIDSAIPTTASSSRTTVIRTTATTTTGFVSAGSIATTAAPGRRALPRSAQPDSGAARPTTSKPTSSNSPQDEMVLKCVQEMQKLRQGMMAKHNIRNPSSILTDTSLKQIAKKLPLTEREFLLVTNMKAESFQRLGDPFLQISIKYYNNSKK